MSNNAHDLSNRLLNALDNNYNVVDMHTVNEIISILEKINITKELLETTRLGKHVNELRRKSTDPELARRAKVLVKRWRDLVIPHRVETASVPIRSPAPRRLAGTPLTSPALSRHVVSPAVSSPRPPSRPAWGGYESDSQDVILVDDEPCPAASPAPVPAPSPAPTASREHASGEHGNAPKRPASPPSLHEDKKTKRDKKLKKRRGHSRAGSGSEPPAEPPGSGGRPWAALNGSAERSERGPGRPRNGCRNRAVDPYTALVNKIPAAGGKKVKTTLELLQQIQSRGLQQAAADDDDVVLVEDVCPIKPESPVRNGSAEPIVITPEPEPLPPLEDERLRPDCCCGEDEEDPQCPAARVTEIRPFHVVALHNAFLPGVNGTRAPPHPHQFAVRRVNDPDQPGLFTSVVPLYKYSDYADDYCVKNMARVPLCPHLPWTEFAPDPPELPDPPSPPPIRPYPVNDVKVEPAETQSEISQDSVVHSEVKTEYKCKIEPEMVNLPHFEPTDRLKAPILTDQDAKDFGLEIKPQPVVVPLLEVVTEFKKEQEDHRTVEKTKDDTECSFINKVNLDGRTLYALCEKALENVPYNYCQTSSAPTVTLPEDVDEGPKVLESALDEVAADRDVDTLGRPPRPTNFTEWHECAKLGSLIALPYVVID